MPMGGGVCPIPGCGGLILLPTLKVALVLGGGGPSPAEAPPDEAGGGQVQRSCAHNQYSHWITLIRSPQLGGIKVMAMDGMHICAWALVRTRQEQQRQ